MTITTLIRDSLTATAKYEQAKKEYEEAHYGEFDQQRLGIKLHRKMMEADTAIKAVEAHLLKTI